MRRRHWGQLLFGCLFMLMLVAGCKNDMEKELDKIEKKGYTAEIRTRYSKEGIIEKYTIEVYTEEGTREEKYFDNEGNQNGYAVSEYDSENLLTKCSVYNGNGKMTYNREYEYEFDANGNLVAEYSGNEEMGFIDRYKYDEQNRKIYKAEDVAEGTYQEVFYTTYYFYDEEGRLIREEIFATGDPYAYIVYEYDGYKMVKEEKYLSGEYKEPYLEGTEYEYDEEGRLAKCIYYKDTPDNYIGYMTYEYRS